MVEKRTVSWNYGQTVTLYVAFGVLSGKNSRYHVVLFLPPCISDSKIIFKKYRRAHAEIPSVNLE